MPTSTPPSSTGASRGTLGGFSPEAIFVLSGISQNFGSALAKTIFDDLRPATVAWIRVMFAAVVLLGLSWRHWWPRNGRLGGGQPWTRRDVGAAAMFGVAIGLMNMFFYFGIERVDLGKALTIEFVGPIVLAASRTRTRRNAIAVALAAAGVVLLSGLEVSGNVVGLLFIFGASTMWAIYIVIGSRVARQERGLAGLGLALVFSTLVVTPFAAPGASTVFGSPSLLLLCCLVGLLTTIIGHGLDQHVLRHIPAGRFALLLALFPVNATLVGFVVLDERPSALDLVGVACVLAGILSQQRDRVPVAAEDPAV